MNFKLLNLDDKNKDFKFNLSTISEQDWKFFLEDVVLNISEKKQVRSIMASVTIRDNKAKIKLAYEDGNYHEISMTIDAFGSAAHNYSDNVSHIWQDVMGARFGKDYNTELKANVPEVSC